MPIYEFACPRCQRIFQFWGKVSDRNRRPTCPRCGRRNLSRLPSSFAVSTGARSSREREDRDDPLDDLSPAQQARMEREMSELMARAEHLDENDPRELGRFMRRMTEITGMPKDAATEEAIRRMEAGEDPERIEEELGDVFGDLEGGEGRGDGAGMGGYARDEGMYDF